MKARILFYLLMIVAPISLHAQGKKGFSSESYQGTRGELSYRILKPKKIKESEKYPLVLFLHGAGERGDDNQKQLVHGSKLFLDSKNRKEFPCFAVFPQCKKETYWSNAEIDRSSNPIALKFQNGGEPTLAMDVVMELLSELLENPQVDKDRVYVIGLSMGGMGTLEIISRMPNTFAAAIPICGGGNLEATENYKHVPLWVIHGAKDDVVKPQLSVDIVNTLLNKGAYPKFTLYDYANHNSWDPAFAEPELLKWLFSHSK